MLHYLGLLGHIFCEWLWKYLSGFHLKFSRRARTWYERLEWISIGFQTLPRAPIPFLFSTGYGAFYFISWDTGWVLRGGRAEVGWQGQPKMIYNRWDFKTWGQPVPLHIAGQVSVLSDPWHHPTFFCQLTKAFLSRTRENVNRKRNRNG